MDLTSISTIKKILSENNLYAQKSFGQNFLTNQGVLKKIIETAEITEQDLIIEVGPGLGVLTNELIKNAKKVISIEKDKKLIPVLEKNFPSSNNLEVINQDALEFKVPNEDYKVVANIPYNITSPLINHFLQAENKPKTLTLLVQKEVAEKICDKTIAYVLNLQVRLFADSKLIQKVKPGSFMPAPKVDSAVIHLITKNKKHPEYIPTENAIKILKIAKMAFSKKRKKLSNSLKSLLTEEKIKQLEHQKIDLNKRPQHLNLKEWQKLESIIN